MTERHYVIAIDGPSGTGKSTVSQRVAHELHAGYLDTGAMYRIVTLAVLRAGVNPADPRGVAKVLSALNFPTPTAPDQQRHLLSGQDVSTEIRGPAVTLAVTPVSADPAVRAWLLGRQRDIAHSGPMVVEGRDIGTVVVPDAVLKIFLTADASERAWRRLHQNVGTVRREQVGQAALAAVVQDLHRRDTHDATRQHAPLAAAPDAVRIDSSALAVEETVARVLDLARARGIS